MTSGAAQSGTHAIPDGVLVTVGDTEITYDDVVLAGYFTGDWDALVQRCADGQRRDAATSVPAEDLRAAAERFRRPRRLASSHDLHAWLDERDLSFADWEGYLRRDLLSSDSTTPLDAAAGPDTDFASALRADAFCTGFWSEGGARVVAWAVAATLTAHDADEVDLARVRDAIANDPVAPFAGRDEWVAERTALLGRWLAAYQSLDDVVASDAALAATLNDDWSEWSILTIDSCAVASESAAREAISCSNDDNMELEEIARRAHSSIEHRRVRSGDLTDGLAPLLLSTPLGEAVGPLRLGGEWSVVWVRERSAASLEDPTVRAHATATLVDAAVANASKGVVTWRAPR
ncbi:MAG: hypothetical protein KGJ39_05340 [Acidobacteriota bacterium]|nr:hypothetical protein [Acidobacteriota bacterium]